MRNGLTLAECWTVAVLAVIAALTFFFPLFSIHIPIVGDQDVTGYNTASRIRQLTQEVRSASGHGQDGKPSIKLPKLPGANSGAPSKVPGSIRFSWLIPVFIIGAFACAVLTLVGALVSWRVSKFASALGAALAVLALLHLTVMNSDIHTLLQSTLEQGTAGHKANPWAEFARGLGSALVGALKLTPGVGLYVLAISLGLAGLLAYSRVISRMQQ
jgi:hypothetical protein